MPQTAVNPMKLTTKNAREKKLCAKHVHFLACTNLFIIFLGYFSAVTSLAFANYAELSHTSIFHSSEGLGDDINADYTSV